MIDKSLFEEIKSQEPIDSIKTKYSEFLSAEPIGKVFLNYEKSSQNEDGISGKVNGFIHGEQRYVAKSISTRLAYMTRQSVEHKIYENTKLEGEVLTPNIISFSGDIVMNIDGKQDGSVTNVDYDILYFTNGSK